MGGRSILALALLVAAAACTQNPEVTDATSTTAPASTTTSTTGSSSSDPGRLAVIDPEDGVVVIDPDGENRQVVTEGADNGNPSLFMQPVWSPDGATLAWGQRTGTGFGVGISTPGSDLITTLSTPNLPFYTYWSPDSRHLGVLHNGNTGVQFQIVDVSRESTSLLDEDAPFYFSWSPDGDMVVTHAGATRAETLTPDGERVELEPTTANYLAPQWTAKGVFHVVGDRLVLEDDQGERRPVAEVSGLTLFVANSEGSRVGLQSTGQDGDGLTAATEDFPEVTTDAVVVFDVETGDTEVVHDSASVGFFWSRDGRSLLVLAAADGRLTPKVWSVDGGETEYPPFRPTQTLVQDTLPFFPQYAQSVSFWSPDSSAFAFAGEVDGETGVWVQALDESSPTKVAEGTWVSWSPGQP